MQSQCLVLLLQVLCAVGLRLCFHLNELNFRGTVASTFNYAHYAETLLGHESVILHPVRRDLSSLPLFQERFPGAVYGYNGSETEDYVGGTLMRQLLVDAKCEWLYVVKYGTIQSSPSYPMSFQEDLPTVVHAVFHLQFHGVRIICAPVNKYLPYYLLGSEVVPHIVNAAPQPSVAIEEAVQDFKEFMGIPSTALVVCGFGGGPSFNIPFALDAVAQLLALHAPTSLHFLFAGVEVNIQHVSVTSLGPILNSTAKEVFLQSCHCLLHARAEGETFGLSVAEFSARNKPVLTHKGFDGQHASELEHVRILGSKGFYYSSQDDIVNTLTTWIKTGLPVGDFNAYKQFTPNKVYDSSYLII